jgi:hypothetical protein
VGDWLRSALAVLLAGCGAQAPGLGRQLAPCERLNESPDKSKTSIPATFLRVTVRV